MSWLHDVDSNERDRSMIIHLTRLIWVMLRWCILRAILPTLLTIVAILVQPIWLPLDAEQGKRGQARTGS